MAVSVESIHLFFDPLVGTPERTTALEHDLATSLEMAHIGGGREITDPYVKLFNSVKHKMHVARNNLVDENLKANGDDPVTARALLTSNAVFGGSIAVAALSTVGTIYSTVATAQQTLATVEQNTDQILRAVYGAAFTDTYNANINLGALRYGANPHNLITAPLLRFLGSNMPDVRISPRSFQAIADQQGQLTIRPRYEMRRGKGRGLVTTSPSAGETRNQPTQPALFTFMKTIGAVANKYIYPNQFPITES